MIGVGSNECGRPAGHLLTLRWRNDHTAGQRFSQFRRVARVGKKADGGPGGTLQRTNAVYAQAGITDQFSAELLGNLTRRNGACHSLGALRVERLDDLVSDVDLGASEHGFLQDEVVLLGLEDLLDDLVGALHD